MKMDTWYSSRRETAGQSASASRMASSIEMPQMSVLSEMTFRKMLRLSAPTRRRVAISLARKPVRAVVILI